MDASGDTEAQEEAALQAVNEERLFRDAAPRVQAVEEEADEEEANGRRGGKMKAARTKQATKGKGTKGRHNGKENLWKPISRPVNEADWLAQYCEEGQTFEVLETEAETPPPRIERPPPSFMHHTLHGSSPCLDDPLRAVLVPHHHQPHHHQPPTLTLRLNHSHLCLALRLLAKDYIKSVAMRSGRFRPSHFGGAPRLPPRNTITLVPIIHQGQEGSLITPRSTHSLSLYLCLCLCFSSFPLFA